MPAVPHPRLHLLCSILRLVASTCSIRKACGWVTLAADYPRLLTSGLPPRQSPPAPNVGCPPANHRPEVEQGRKPTPSEPASWQSALIPTSWASLPALLWSPFWNPDQHVGSPKPDLPRSSPFPLFSALVQLLDTYGIFQAPSCTETPNLNPNPVSHLACFLLKSIVFSFF